jgi:O-antigen ligase
MSAGRSAATWEWARVLVPWSCLALLPFGRLVEAPVAVMALGGIVVLTRRGRAWLHQPGPALLLGTFACIWIPILISAVGAVRPDEALRIAGNHLRFLLAGLFMIEALGSRAAQIRFIRLCAWLLALWSVDALVQWASGVDLLGQRTLPARITGPFGERSGKFGLILAVLAPLVLEHARRAWPRPLLAACAAVLVVVVFVGGTRSGWICAAVVGGCYFVYAWRSAGRVPWRLTAAALLACIAMVVGAYSLSDRVEARIDEIGSFLQGTEVWNPFKHRIWIWKGGWNMFLAEPLNGVGARGFRYAFVDHAAPGDPYLAYDPPLRPTHSHQLVIEIAAETGTLGLVGLMLATLLLLRAAARAPPSGRDLLVPAGFALVAAFWPLNTHLALFSSFWSQLVWWLIGLYCAALAAAWAPGSTGPADTRA